MVYLNDAQYFQIFCRYHKIRNGSGTPEAKHNPYPKAKHNPYPRGRVKLLQLNIIRIYDYQEIFKILVSDLLGLIKFLNWRLASLKLLVFVAVHEINGLIK